MMSLCVSACVSFSHIVSLVDGFLEFMHQGKLTVLEINKKTCTNTYLRARLIVQWSITSIDAYNIRSVGSKSFANVVTLGF